MFILLDSKDKNVLENSNFTKNAMFYKDMLCFHNAYSQILDKQESLPNFCFAANGELCLEGICLLIKMYATEFKFDTIRLTLDYLKILYYANAVYAENDIVDSDIIAEEFDGYRRASEEYCGEVKREMEDKLENLNQKKKEVDTKNKKINSMKRWSKILKIAAWIFLGLSVLSISLPVYVAINKLPALSLVGSILGVVAELVITILCLVYSKKLHNHFTDLIFSINNTKKELNTLEEEFVSIQSKFYKVFCEKYEYSMCFLELFSKFVDILSIDEILNKANGYKLLSYNIVYDIARLFKDQQTEIDSLIFDIENINLSQDYQSEFEKIYSKIIQQDWLYYNLEIRFHFLKKFTDISERQHQWTLDFNGEQIKPFGIDVKGLSREKVAFTESENIKFVEASLSELTKTKYFKNLEEMNFRNGYSIDEVKKVKSNYLMHFYDMRVLEGNSDFFYDKKTNRKITRGVPFDRIMRIPSLIGMKFKLIEHSAGLGNSESKVIKTIANSIFEDYFKDEVENLTFREEYIDYPKFTASKIERHDDVVEFYVGGEKITGYKINVN